MKDKLRIVLDTNILLSAVSRFSPYNGIMQAWENDEFDLCVTTEILLEYEEKLAQNFSPLLAELTLGAFLLKQNVIHVEVFLTWELITNDPDDNKFVNCALWGNADYLVSNDKHFRVLKDLDFPKIEVLTIETFIGLL